MNSSSLTCNPTAAERLHRHLPSDHPRLCYWAFPTAQAAEHSVKLAGMDVTVWSQEVDKGVKQPVIIFSHGFHGCATQSRFLMEAFASAGYLVFAPNHRDAICNGGKAKWIDRPQMPFRKPQNLERIQLPRSRGGYTTPDQRPFERTIGFVNERIGAASVSRGIPSEGTRSWH